jgi:hypothetical protein
MKRMLQSGIIIGMIILSTNAFSQTKGLESDKTYDGKKTAKTYMDLMVNMVSTNLNYGRYNSALADYKKSASGIQAGISFQAGITPGFSMVTEFYFMRIGGNLKANNPLSNSESNLRLNTLELPVLARFHFGKLYVNTGPAIAYNISGSRKIDDQSTKLSFINSSEGFKRLDASVQIGGGYEFPWKQRRIALDIRYSYGLTNISNNTEMHSRALMISVRISKPWTSNPLGKK